MRSTGYVLLTAISATCSGERPERRAAASIRSRTSAIFSAIGIRTRNHEEHQVTRRRSGIPSCNFVSVVAQDLSVVQEMIRGSYIIATGGAGSLGSPAAEAGTKIISAASPASTIMPPTR